MGSHTFPIFLRVQILEEHLLLSSKYSQVWKELHSWCLSILSLPLQLQASSQNSSLDIAKSVDNLLDHIIATGWSASDMCAVRMRQWSGAKPEPGEHLYRKYLELYKQVVPYMDFDSLPSSGSQPNDWSSTNFTEEQIIHIFFFWYIMNPSQWYTCAI